MIVIHLTLDPKPGVNRNDRLIVTWFSEEFANELPTEILARHVENLAQTWRLGRIEM